jgi:hypothetical protein
MADMMVLTILPSGRQSEVDSRHLGILPILAFSPNGSESQPDISQTPLQIVGTFP